MSKLGPADTIEAAARDLVRHIDRMADNWAEMGATESGREARNRELWAPLHTKADRLAGLLDAPPDGYALVLDDQHELTYVQRFGSGTVQLTIKPKTTRNTDG